MEQGDPGYTTLAVQHYLDELAGVGGDAPAEPMVSALLARCVYCLHTSARRLSASSSHWPIGTSGGC